MKIGFVSMPLSRHLNPMTALAGGLQSRGNEVVFFGVPDVEPFARAAGLNFVPYSKTEYPVGSIGKVFSSVAKLHGFEIVRRFPYAKRLGMMALVLAVACMARDSSAETAKESIAVPPHARLRLRAVGSGDQIYGCLNGNWELKAPDAKLVNQEGSVIGQHFAGPTWQLNDGSRIKGKVVAKQVAPDATAVPWLLLESVGGTGRLGAVRFIQRTGTHGGNAPDGGCSQSTMRRVPYTAIYSFYEAGQ